MARHLAHLTPLACGLALALLWRALITPFLPALGWVDTAVRVAVPALAALLWKRVHPVALHPGAVWAVGLWGSLGTLAVVALALADGGAPAPMRALATLVGVSPVYVLAFLLWAELYALLDVVGASVALAGSYVAAPLLYAGTSLLPDVLAPGIAAMLPLMGSGALLLAAGRLAPSHPAPAPARPWRELLGGVPWRIVAVVALVTFAAGVNRCYTTTAVDMVAAGIAGALLLVVALGLARRLSVFLVYKVALPVMMAGLVVGVVAGSTSLLAQVCVNVSYGFAMMVLILFLCDKAHRFGGSAFFMNAVARVCTTATFAVGAAVAGLLDSLFGPAGPIHATALYVLTLAGVAFAMFFWLSDGTSVAEFRKARPAHAPGIGASDAPVAAPGPDRTPGDALAPDEEPVPTAALLQRLLAERSTQVAAEYHLSAREAQVLELLAWGKSAKRIEELLVLSPNTVKTHVRHIYTKLGIHSRAELDALLHAEG
jgi:DNA-binding CsgD family transcriptional regulator